MELNIAFGRVIRKYRKLQSITQEELAHDCDLDRTYISMIERGINLPSWPTLFSIAARLKVRPSKILSDIEELITATNIN